MSSSSSSESGSGESSSSSSGSRSSIRTEDRPTWSPAPKMASPDVSVDVIWSDEEVEDEVILDLNAIPLLTDSYVPLEGSVGSDAGEASTTLIPGRAVEVVARARMDANPKYNIQALNEENHLDESMLVVIRDKYCIPSRFGLREATEGDRACNESSDVCIYDESLRAGLRFPMHPFFASVLQYYGLAPAQVAPNSWRLLIGFVYLIQGRLQRNLSVPLFHACAQLKRHKGGGYIYISQHPEVKMITGIPSSIHLWRNRFFYVEDRVSSGPWPVPLKWGTPDAVAMSRKPLLEGEDARTLALLQEVLDREGPIDCSNFQGEEVLVGLGLSTATRARTWLVLFTTYLSSFSLLLTGFVCVSIFRDAPTVFGRQNEEGSVWEGPTGPEKEDRRNGESGAIPGHGTAR
ncbi:uncharacterized protein LOC143862603 [Tasmannia lanceolata]|uniref:uncharacterized protein LOC143862603 n=1 Tax=Tasmannia lanceolata TaxID=3420 RepID=UPI004063F3FA